MVQIVIGNTALQSISGWHVVLWEEEYIVLTHEVFRKVFYLDFRI